MRRVLVVDDEENIRLVLRTLLKKQGYDVEVADGGESALGALESFDPDVILTDVRMPRMGGLDLLATLKAKQHPATVIVMSAYGNVDMAIEAIKAGAYDYVSKPFKPDEVVLALRKAEERETLRRENRALREQIHKDNQFESILAKSREMLEIFRTIAKIADFKTTVLITGESGTGKELVARAVHARSNRAAMPFVAVNCGAIPENLLESELFGHKRGAFTDASSDRRGLFEEATGGTLFLDEIGDMDLVAQAKVLRALQSGEVSRVGSEHVMHVDVRVLAATNKDLAKEVDRQTFRDDLFFRLNVFPLRSPSLRERVEDIPVLAEAFMVGFSRENGTKPKPIDPDVLRALVLRKWPGNVRELKNVVERMAILSGDRVTIADLPEDPHESPFGEEEPFNETSSTSSESDDDAPSDGGSGGGGGGGRGSGPPPGHLTLREYREKSERQYIVDTLKMTGWNISRTAIVLGVERTNLHKKIRTYTIKRQEA
jgi:two-component system response regulator AtoC